MEKIIASAVYIRNLPSVIDNIHSRTTPCQPTNCNIGDIVVGGLRHMSCWYSIFALTGMVQNDFRDAIEGKRLWEEGFLTDGNRFLTRGEAYDLAKANGQLIKRVGENGDVLFESRIGQFYGEKTYMLTSEDLW